MNPHTPPSRRPGRSGRGALGRLVAGLRCLAFWTAILLTFGWAPVLLVWETRPAVVVGLVSAHAAALFVGHVHNQPAEGDSAGRHGRAGTGSEPSTPATGSRNHASTSD